MIRRLRLALFVGAACAGAGFVACLPGSGPALLDPEDASGDSLNLDDDSGTRKSDVDLGDPFALEGLSPSHGPWNGGTRARLSGRGFSSLLRVFLGSVEVSPESILASDPTRAAVVTPPGTPGFVDVRIVDDVTKKERILPKGYLYDAFYVEPLTGATSGGTRIALRGSGTNWVAGTTVSIGGAACDSVVVSGPTSIDCITPIGAPGAKDVTVTTPDSAQIQARDAFIYSDSVDGYRGGLSGGAFTGRVRVLAFDAFTGTPIGDAFAIAGASLPSAVVQKTLASGVTEINGLAGSNVTITVAAKCHHPMTFVDVPVDTVTAYLSPVLDPSCAVGDPPSTGGGGGIYGGMIEGQIIFPGAGEFQKAGWTVPAPLRPTERRAAYVFEASSTPNDVFQLPAPSAAITPDSGGTTGDSYSIVVYPGNVTIYVIAGLEDRSESPPRFVPYVMGVARGVSVPSQTHVTGVDVKMDILFDHRVTIAPTPPAPGPYGPDRLRSRVALTLGSAGYAILPRGEQTTVLPAPGTIPFVGVPSLDHGIAGEQYVLGAVAATGANFLVPASVVSRVKTSNANDPVSLGGFLGVPVPVAPAGGAWNGTHVEFSGGAGPVDMSLVQVSSGSGLVTWTIAAPGGVTSFDVPDLAALPGPNPVGLVHGPITTTVQVARIDGFSYGNLRSGHLSSASWNAYAFDTKSGAY